MACRSTSTSPSPTIAAPTPSPGATAAPAIPSPLTLASPAAPIATPTSVPTDAPATIPTRPALPAPTRQAIGGNSERLRPDGPPHDPGPLDWAHPGPYLDDGFRRSELSSFGATQPLLTTYYFCWFDLTNPANRETDWSIHLADPDHYSFLSPATHRQQFKDMQAAGIDFALPVYWGEPGHPGRAFNPTPGHFWSTEGIPPMVEALDQLASSGHPFKIGMFYDTTILANADLTTASGKAYFYVNVRDFYSRIPPKFWAAIGGKPIVWLYDTQWVSRFDQSTFDDLAERFARDFGGLRPYVVRELQWYQAKGVQTAAVLGTDNLYAWGAAPFGFNEDPRLGVAEVGPGFNNTNYCKGSAAQGCFDVSRENGAYYARQLAAALRSGRRIIAIETWNELDEGSGIADTVELGRAYIDLTRKYADAFHAGRRIIG